MPSCDKEIHYFDRQQNFAAGPDWYRAHWPRVPVGTLAYESTPFYLMLPDVPRRINHLLPDVVIVALVRNPTERAISHHAHQVRLGHEKLSLDEALDAEESRLCLGEPGTAQRALTHFGYQQQGRYAEQLERYFATFAPEQVIVVKSEDLFARPNEAVNRVLHAAALSPMPTPLAPVRLNASAEGTVDHATRERLDRAFAEPNAQLEALIGRRLGWGRE